MFKSIFSGILLLISAFLSFKHGYDSFQIHKHPESAKMMSNMGINERAGQILGIFSLLTGLLLLFPKTFFISNLINAITIVIIMALALRSDNYQLALMEIPFLAIPLLLIWLKHPIKI